MQHKLFNIFVAFILAFSMVPLSRSSAVADEGMSVPVFTLDSSDNSEGTESVESAETAGASSAGSGSAAMANPAATSSNAATSATNSAVAAANPGAQVDFNQSAEVDGVVVQVSAAPGVFPAGSTLHVQRVPAEDAPEVDAAVQRQRADSTNTALAYNFDIAVLDAEGTEVQPAEGADVHVSFTLAAVANENLDTQVYHVTEAPAAEAGQDAFVAQLLAVEVDEALETATVVTDGFSYYTVEFTYGELVYVLDGGDYIKLSDLLDYVGLEGTASNVELSSDVLFDALYEVDDWYIYNYEPFETEEWLRVTIEGIVYEITLTDAIVPGDDDDKTFASQADLATAVIDKSKLVLANVKSFSASGAGGQMKDINGNTVNATLDATTGDVRFEDLEMREANPTANGFMQAGNISFYYENAVILSDGTRTDLNVEIGPIRIASRKNFTSTPSPSWHSANGTTSYTDTITILNLGTNGNAFRIVGRSESAGIGFGYRFDTITFKVGNALSDDTYIYTIKGINLNRVGQSSFDNLAWASSNRSYSEQLQIKSGVSGDIYVKDSSPFKSLSPTSILGPSGISNDDGTYTSGFAANIEAKSGFASQMWQHAPSYTGAKATSNTYLLQDGITSTITSSSGYYGKILTTKSGTQADAIAENDVLYGGRYVDDKNGNMLVNQKRTYDVTLGKDVWYKLVPEDGYIIDKLYIGSSTDDWDNTTNIHKNEYTSSADVKTLIGNGDLIVKYNNDDPKDGVEYYLYKFPAITTADQNREIHVSWQPKVDLEFTKKWEDLGNKYQMRPATIEIELQQNGSTYDINRNSVTGLYNSTKDRSINAATPDSNPITAFNDSCDSSSTADAWVYNFYNLPKYSTYDDSTNTGENAYTYTVKETLGTEQAYYKETKAHKLTESDSAKTVQYVATGTTGATGDQNRGYADTYPDGGTYYDRTLDYEITNELEYTDLHIQKDVVAPTGDGSFKYKVELTTPASANLSTDGFSGSGTNWVKDNITVSGDSKDTTSVIEIPKGTTFTVTEAPDDDWILETKNGDSGAIMSSDIYAWEIIGGGKRYIKKVTPEAASSTHYDLEDDTYIGDENAMLADVATATSSSIPSTNPKYYAPNGLEIQQGSSGWVYVNSGQPVSKDYDAATVAGLPGTGFTITYSTTPKIKGNYIVYEPTITGITPDGFSEDDIVVAKALHRAYFENIKVTEFEVKKQWLDSDLGASHTEKELLEAFHIYAYKVDENDPSNIPDPGAAGSVDITSKYVENGASKTWKNAAGNDVPYVTVAKSDDGTWIYKVVHIPGYEKELDGSKDSQGACNNYKDRELKHYVTEDKSKITNEANYLDVDYSITTSPGTWPEDSGGTLKKYAKEDEVVINREKHELKIEKFVTGNQGSRDKYFKFSVQIENAGNDTLLELDMTNAVATLSSVNAATIYTAATISAANSKDDDAAAGQQIKCNNGTATFDIYLQHGQSVVIKGIPNSAKYTVTEAKEDYKPATSVSGDDTKDSGVGSTTDIVVGANKDTITDSAIVDDAVNTFTNTRDGVVPTEIRVPGWESCMLLFIAMLGLALLAMRRNRTVKEVAHEGRASQFPVRSSQKHAKAMRKTQPKHKRST